MGSRSITGTSWSEVAALTLQLAPPWGLCLGPLGLPLVKIQRSVCPRVPPVGVPQVRVLRVAWNLG